MSTQDLAIIARARTPIGSFQGTLSSITATRLGAAAISAALSQAKLNPAEIDEVIMGNVLQAGVGQAPARQAALASGLPTSVPCTTVNKVCGSAMKAIMMARQSILLGESKIVVAGGMESMSNAPYLLPTARAGMRMGNQIAVDAMINDGLWDPYGNAHMGCFGDQCAEKYGFTREQQDAFARSSYERVQAAERAGFFASERVPVTVEVRGKSNVIEVDEEPARYSPDKMATLKAAFGKSGTVTAANASKVNDGAAALVLMDNNEAQKRSLKALAHIVSVGGFAQDPAWFTTAPIGAIQNALKAAKLSIRDVDVFEINEAFAGVALATMKELDLPLDRVNRWGGAIALGHPIGASGARIVCTLISILERENKHIGCAAICLGGGEALAMIIRRA